jgi:hypothetical protein
LVLQTSVIKSGCVKQSNNVYGNKDVNAIYQINDYSSENIQNFNKLAYVDADSKLRIYPESMIQKSNKYITYPNYDSTSVNIALPKTIIKNENACKKICTSNKDCSGYVNDTNAKSCSLKGGNVSDIFNNKKYVSGTPNSNYLLGLRKPQIIKNSVTTCNKDIVDIDTIKFNKYSNGTDMNKNVDCNALKELDPLYKKVNFISDSMNTTSDAVTEQNNLFISSSNTNSEQMIKNKTLMNAGIDTYKKHVRDIGNLTSSSGFQNLYSDNNYIEGMQNLTQNLLISDVNGMLSDSDTRILQANYSYILWSVLAVGLLSITVNTINK